MSRIVVDASVAVKWLVPERGSEEAAKLLDSPFDLIAPALIHAEVGNTFWKKVGRGEIDVEEGRELLDAFRSMPLTTTDSQALLPGAFEIAVELSLTVYDSLYLALAVASECVLVTDDGRLAERVAASPLGGQVRRLTY